MKIQPANPGNNVLTRCPLREIAKAIEGATPNIDNKKTNVLSPTPNLQIEIGILAATAEINITRIKSSSK